MAKNMYNKRGQFIAQFCYSPEEGHAVRYSPHEVAVGRGRVTCIGSYYESLLEICRKVYPKAAWRKISRAQYEREILGPSLLKEAEKMKTRGLKMIKKRASPKTSPG